MKPLSFIPGLTKISDAVYHDIDQALISGFLELSYRDGEFIAMTDR
jgi:hypothetical protein